MIRSSQLTYNIFKFLNKTSKYAVLRNYEGLPLINKSRDIDVLVEKKEFLKIEKTIISLITELDFKITTLYRSEKLITYVCACATNSKVDLVQFDFFFNTSLFGILLLDAKRVLSTRLYNGSVYHVSKEYEFLDKYIQMRFLNKPYPEKYNKLKDEVEKNNSDSIAVLIKEHVNYNTIAALEKVTPSSLKRKQFFLSLKKYPIDQIKNFGAFWWYYLQNRIVYKGFSIGFTGPDGAGKTTIINAIIEDLRKTYSSIDLYHFRPTITPDLGKVAHKLNLKSEVDQDYANPHRGERTGKLSSLIRLIYYGIDYILGYFLRIQPTLSKRKVVIFDRYFTDVIADSRRSRIYLNSNFLYWFGKFFIPKLDYNILLTADKDIILGRKQELTAEGIDRINNKLEYLSKKRGYHLVLNNKDPEDAIQEILTIIFEEQHKKNIKRIG